MENIKIAIMHGNIPIDGIEKDGEIDYIYRQTPDKNHVPYYIDYLQNHYNDNQILQSFNLYSSVGNIQLTLKDLNNVIFVDTTSYDDNNNSLMEKNCLVIVPNIITEKQKKNLSIIKEIAKEYEEIFIWYNFSIKDGIPLCSVLNNKEIDIDKLFEFVINNIEIENKKTK